MSSRPYDWSLDEPEPGADFSQMRAFIIEGGIEQKKHELGVLMDQYHACRRGDLAGAKQFDEAALAPYRMAQMRYAVVHIAECITAVATRREASDR